MLAGSAYSNVGFALLQLLDVNLGHTSDLRVPCLSYAKLRLSALYVMQTMGVYTCTRRLQACMAYNEDQFQCKL